MRSDALDLFTDRDFLVLLLLPIEIVQNSVAQSADSGERGGVNILVLHKFLQAGKDLVAGCENDGEDTLSTGFMKQLGLHGSLSYVRLRPVLRPVQSPPSSRH
jgi:hypothetical protein